MAIDSLMKLVYCWSRIEKPGSMLLKCMCATADVEGEHQGSRRALSFSPTTSIIFKTNGICGLVEYVGNTLTQHPSYL
jgi:hypothetical protein